MAGSWVEYKLPLLVRKTSDYKYALQDFLGARSRGYYTTVSLFLKQTSVPSEIECGCNSR